MEHAGSYTGSYTTDENDMIDTGVCYSCNTQLQWKKGLWGKKETLQCKKCKIKFSR